MKMKKLNKAAVILCSVISTAALLTVSVSAENTYAQGIGRWILDGVFWVIVIAAVVIMLKQIMSQNISKAVITFLVAAVLCFLTTEAGITALKSLGAAIAGIAGLTGSGG